MSRCSRCWWHAVLGAGTKTAATVALVVAVALLLVQGWMVARRPPAARGLRLLAVTLTVGGFGVMMILLKLLVTH
jgi:4-hydroxybenzoate polyprenyltransferase